MIAQRNKALVKRREEQALTQVEVAKRAGVTERSYQKYEAGEQTPSVRIAKQIAKALNTTVEALF